MTLTSDKYVPSLRWRQGEYQALLRLSDSAKRRIVPYITIPEIEFDFEEWRPRKSIHEHVHPFPTRYKAKWDQRPAWIGVHASIVDEPMDDGRDIFTYTFDALRTFQAHAVPAILLETSPMIVASVRAILATDRLGAAISVRLEDLMKPDTKTRIENLVSSLGASIDEIDLVIDLGAPNFEPHDAFAGALITALRQLSNLHAYRNFILIGTAIPKTFADVARGADQLPRNDWLFYCKLLRKIPRAMRRPNFGDYTIVHPEFKAIDMRKVKPAGKVIYTTPDRWEVRKGSAFRDNPKQMYDHCASIVASGAFKGSGYSSGDDYIAKCAIRQEGPSNQTRWKDVCINHHMTQVLDDLAMLCVSP